MLKDIEEFLALRQETIQLGKRTIVVRELDAASALGEYAGTEDSMYAIAVRCCLDEKGVRVFTDDDIPKLKAGSQRKLQALFSALARVNGLDSEDEQKK